ncbi:MAG: hypothetical protein AAF525_09240 [Pseudomonadota bacterium]
MRKTFTFVFLVLSCWVSAQETDYSCVECTLPEHFATVAATEVWAEADGLSLYWGQEVSIGGAEGTWVDANVRYSDSRLFANIPIVSGIFPTPFKLNVVVTTVDDLYVQDQTEVNLETDLLNSLLAGKGRKAKYPLAEKVFQVIQYLDEMNEIMESYSGLMNMSNPVINSTYNPYLGIPIVRSDGSHIKQRYIFDCIPSPGAICIE